MAKPAPLPSADDLIQLLLDIISAKEPAGHEAEEYPVFERDGVIYGRVFCDAEGQALAQLFADQSLLNEDLKGFGWLDSTCLVKNIQADIFLNRKLAMYFMGKTSLNVSH